MKLHYFRYFSVLAEELHFGRAAQRLAITQPPLSGAIKALEAELGTQLLIRDSKHVELTPAGEAFWAEAVQILERVDRASSLTRAVAGGLKGRLDVGVTGSLMYRELPAIVERFQRSMPGVEVVLRELPSAQQVEDLLRAQLHAGFINTPTVPPQLDSMPLADDEFVCCLPTGHALALRKSVKLSALADEKFVMFARAVAPANHDNLVAILSREGIHPRMVHAARQWLTVIAMVAHNCGVALVPRSLIGTGMKQVVFVPFEGAPKLSPALLAWNPARMSEAQKSFLKCAQAELNACGKPLATQQRVSPEPPLRPGYRPFSRR
ncbi:MAG: LysR family transcriptional regulator [Pseudomonadota bacterium]|nr:LysR family transcriptional regulator [Pseudomonadota bacterium]